MQTFPRSLLALLVAWMICPAIARADEPPLDDPAVLQKLLDTKLPLVDKGQLTPAGAAKLLADLGGVNVFVDASALRNAGYHLDAKTVFVSAKNITLSTAFDRLVKSIETPKDPLHWSVEGGVVVLTTADAKSTPLLRTAAENNDKDDAFTNDEVIDEIDFADVDLRKAIKELRLHGINIYLHWAALNQIGIDLNNHLHFVLHRVRPRTAMQTFVRELSGTDARVSFAIRDGVWAISTPADLKRQVHLWDWRPYHVKDQPTANKLANGVEDIGFDALPLNDAFDQLSRMGDLVFDVDWPSLATAGIDRKTPVTVSVRHLKIATPIDLVLTEAGGLDHSIDYTAKDGTLSIALKPEPATKPTSRPSAGK
jgi:hypothetical protein